MSALERAGVALVVGWLVFLGWAIVTKGGC